MIIKIILLFCFVSIAISSDIRSWERSFDNQFESLSFYDQNFDIKMKFQSYFGKFKNKAEFFIKNKLVESIERDNNLLVVTDYLNKIKNEYVFENNLIRHTRFFLNEKWEKKDTRIIPINETSFALIGVNSECIAPKSYNDLPVTLQDAIDSVNAIYRNGNYNIVNCGETPAKAYLKKKMKEAMTKGFLCMRNLAQRNYGVNRDQTEKLIRRMMYMEAISVSSRGVNVACSGQNRYLLPRGTSGKSYGYYYETQSAIAGRVDVTHDNPLLVVNSAMILAAKNGDTEQEKNLEATLFHEFFHLNGFFHEVNGNIPASWHNDVTYAAEECCFSNSQSQAISIHDKGIRSPSIYPPRERGSGCREFFDLIP